MNFQLTTSGTFFSLYEAERLRKLGFEMLKVQSPLFQDTPFRVDRTQLPYKRFKDLEELVEFVREWQTVGLRVTGKGARMLELYV